MVDKTARMALLGALIVVAGAWQIPPSVAAGVDFRVLVQQHFDAHNRSDVAGVMMTLSEDIVMTAPGLCFATPCVGTGAVEREIQNRVNLHANLTLVSLRESSGVGTGKLRVSADNIRACNVDRILVDFDLEVRNDKISRYTARPDVTDAPTRAYLSCVAAGPGSGVRPPSTGNGGLRGSVDD